MAGYVVTIFLPVPATQRIRHQELILRAAARNQPAHGLVNSKLAEQHLHLPDGRRLGGHSTVGFPVHRTASPDFSDTPTPFSFPQGRARGGEPPR